MNSPQPLKLRIVPASQGLQWVKLGITTFFKQPLALSSLFFLFVLFISAISRVPFLGSALCLFLLPATTLSFMIVSKEASTGNTPRPFALLHALRTGRQELRSMAILGALYVLGFSLALALSALVDDGKFASFYLLDSNITPELLETSNFLWAALLVLVLYLPLSFLFWHAPALVHWHGTTPLKSLFFSLVACWRNFAALSVYGLAWTGIFLASSVLTLAITALSNTPEFASTILFPAYMLMTAMVFVSQYFSFRDSFESSAEETP